MFTLLFMMFGVACLMHSGQACMYCEPNEYELSEYYCHPFTRVFLVQGEVVAETGPLLDPQQAQALDKELAMVEWGVIEYTMAVKKVYRDDSANIHQTVAIVAYTNTTNCGARLKLGKNYVLSGTFYTVLGVMTFETWACEYIREYDTEVEVVLPDCPDLYD